MKQINEILEKNAKRKECRVCTVFYIFTVGAVLQAYLICIHQVTETLNLFFFPHTKNDFGKFSPQDRKLYIL